MRPVRARTVLAAGAALALAVSAVSLAVGAYAVPLRDVAAALTSLLGGDAPAATARTVVLDLRLPRAVAALCVGSALGTAGAVLQGLLRNPLASPFVIGTAQAAGFGAVLAIFFRLGTGATLAFAFAASVLAAVLVLALSRTRRSLPTESVVLTGLAVSLLFGAGIGLVRYLAHDEGVVGRIALWMMGGLWSATWPPLAVMAPPLLVAVVATCLLWRRLDLLALGAEDAERLGLAVRRAGTAFLLLSCALTALAVCIGGVVAFVGLIVPHAARRLVGPAHSVLLPASALLGASFVVAMDTVARTLARPEEVPLGIVTSLVGVPAFLVVLRSVRGRRAGL